MYSDKIEMAVTNYPDRIRVCDHLTGMWYDIQLEEASSQGIYLEHSPTYVRRAIAIRVPSLNGIAKILDQKGIVTPTLMIEPANKSRMQAADSWLVWILNCPTMVDRSYVSFLTHTLRVQLDAIDEATNPNLCPNFFNTDWWNVGCSEKVYALNEITPSVNTISGIELYPQSAIASMEMRRCIDKVVELGERDVDTLVTIGMFVTHTELFAYGAYPPNVREYAELIEGINRYAYEAAGKSLGLDSETTAYH